MMGPVGQMGDGLLVGRTLEEFSEKKECGAKRLNNDTGQIQEEKQKVLAKKSMVKKDVAEIYSEEISIGGNIAEERGRDLGR